MQFTMTTDYALRIVTYLSQKGDVVTTSQLSNELQIPMNYIPMIFLSDFIKPVTSGQSRKFKE